VTFGAFVEILDGVEGLVHISELAPHHVENPREIVSPGDDVKVKILEIDSERRRLSLSVKRVEGQVLTPKVLPPEEQGAGDLDDLPELGLSEEVFASGAAPEAPALPALAELADADADAVDAPEADAAAEPEAAQADLAAEAGTAEPIEDVAVREVLEAEDAEAASEPTATADAAAEPAPVAAEPGADDRA
jgi:small subunit ribosomal protein S1